MENKLSLQHQGISTPRHFGANGETVWTIGPDTSVLGRGYLSTSAEVSSYCNLQCNISKTVHSLKILRNTCIASNAGACDVCDACIAQNLMQLVGVHILLCYTSECFQNQSNFVNSITYWYLANTLAWVTLNFTQGPEVLYASQAKSLCYVIILFVLHTMHALHLAGSHT